MNHHHHRCHHDDNNNNDNNDDNEEIREQGHNNTTTQSVKDQAILPYETAKNVVLQHLRNKSHTATVDHDGLADAFRHYSHLAFDCALFEPHRSALAAAVSLQPSLELVQLLYELDPDSIHKTGTFTQDAGMLPLHMACATGASVRVIRYLVQQYPESIRVATRDGMYPLHVACESSDPALDVVAFLVETCPAALLESRLSGCHVSYTVVESALRNGCDPAVVEVLLDNHEPPLAIAIQQAPKACRMAMYVPVLLGRSYPFESFSLTVDEPDVLPVVLVCLANNNNNSLRDVSLTLSVNEYRGTVSANHRYDDFDGWFDPHHNGSNGNDNDHDDDNDDKDNFPSVGLEFFLRKNKTVRSFHLGTSIPTYSETAADALLDGLSHNSTLRKLHLQNFGFAGFEDRLTRLFTRNQSVTSYRFTSVKVSSDLASVLAIGLAVRDNVQELYLEDCDLVGEDLPALLTVLRGQDRLRHLTIDLVRCESPQTDHLQDLANLCQLQSLRLLWPIVDEDVSSQPLLELLERTTRLQELTVEEYSRAAELVPAFRNNKSVRSLAVLASEDVASSIPLWVDLLRYHNQTLSSIRLTDGNSSDDNDGSDNANVVAIGCSAKHQDIAALVYHIQLNVAGRRFLHDPNVSKQDVVTLLEPYAKELSVLYGLLREVPHIWSGMPSTSP